MRDFPREVSPWATHEYLLPTVSTITPEEFTEIKTYNTESEHQVGRYLNWKAVVEEISAQELNGDIIEFGTYQGLGLLMLSRLFEHSTTSRKIIGIDSFEGLPESSNHWIQGQFGDTSSNQVLEYFEQYFPKNTNLSYDLIKGWFNEPHVAETLYNICYNPVIIHFDADLGSSTSTALSISEHYLLGRTDPIFFLFDDWGNSPLEVPVAWNTWLSTAKDKFNLSAEDISSTVHTRNFRITFN